MGFKENQPKERITEKTLKEIETRKLATKCKQKQNKTTEIL